MDANGSCRAGENVSLFVFCVCAQCGHNLAMQSLFFFMLIPDESRVLGGNPSDVTDGDLARTGVSAGEK